jgi:hypothetical protein
LPMLQISLPFASLVTVPMLQISLPIRVFIY